MRSSSRPRLDSSGQGPKIPKSKQLPALGTVVPLAEKRPKRDWAATNDRLRDQGDITILIDTAILSSWRSHRRGRPYCEAVLYLAAVLRASKNLTYRQLEGELRGLLRTMKLPKSLAPDYSTLCRRLPYLELPTLPASRGHADEGVLVIIDSTGVRVTEARGYLQDRSYCADGRKVKYLKLHLGVDALTGELCGYDITRAYGKGTGDSSVAPTVLREAKEWAERSNRHFSGGIGDGAYDAKDLYTLTRELGGTWLAPIPPDAKRGKDPDRNRHIVGVKRLGEQYHDRMGYHERSCIEATNGALKRTMRLSSRARSFETQAAEIAWQVLVYAMGLVRTPRVRPLAVT